MKLSISLKTGIEMKFVAAGPQDAPVLILLHGLTDSRRSWSLSLPELSREYRVYAPDFRGHGDSDAPDNGYTLTGFAIRIAQYSPKAKRDSFIRRNEESFLLGRHSFLFTRQFSVRHLPSDGTGTFSSLACSTPAEMRWRTWSSSRE